MDVWFLDASAPLSPEWLEVLDPKERGRAEDFRTTELRAQYIAAHALVRTALSAYGPFRPAEWRYVYGPWGQPTLVGAPIDLRFSLSHSGRRTAVAVTVGRAVGLDLEAVDPGKDTLPVAKRFFTESEMSLLRGCDDSVRAARFTRLWTVKEAVLKARGVGLGSGLSTVEVALDAKGGLTSVLAPGGPWSAWAWEPEARLAAAVAVQGMHRPHLRALLAAPLGPAVEQPELLPRP